MIEKHRAAVCKDPNSKHPSMSLNAFTPAQLIVMEMMGMTYVKNEDFKVEHDAQQKKRSEWEAPSGKKADKYFTRETCPLHVRC